jgi:hypothetical protein
MIKTLDMLGLYMSEHKPNIHQDNRKSIYRVPNILDRGENLVFNIGGDSSEVEESIDQAVEEEDLTVEYD